MRLTARRLLATSLALPFASPALAGDVVVKLGAGDGFVVEDSTGSEELLRVDQAPDAGVSAQRVIIDDASPQRTTDAALLVTRNASGETPLIVVGDSVFSNEPLQCWVPGDLSESTNAAVAITDTGGYIANTVISLSGSVRVGIDASGNCSITDFCFG